MSAGMSNFMRASRVRKLQAISENPLTQRLGAKNAAIRRAARGSRTRGWRNPKGEVRTYAGGGKVIVQYLPSFYVVHLPNVTSKYAER